MNDRRPPSGWKKRLLGSRALTFALGILLLAAGFEFLAVQFGLPHVPAILSGIGKLWASGTLAHDIQVSSLRWLGGWLIGASVGTALGFLTGRVKVLDVTLEGLLTLCRAIPFISLVPLSVRIFGLTETGKIFLVVWASAGICWVVVHQASRSIPEHLVWRARSLGASPGKWTFRVLLPACKDGVFAGLRASLSLGLVVVAIAELAGVYERSSGRWWSEGIGYRLFRSLDEARDDLLLGTIVVFALLGILADQIFVCSWQAASWLSFRWQQRRVRVMIEYAQAAPSLGGPELAPVFPLTIRDLRAGYDGHEILHGLTLTVPGGATLTIVGPSGCGKTTLIRSIARFADATFYVSGEVVVGGKKVSMPGPDVGVVLQDAPVFDHLTVWDNAMFGNSFDEEEMGRACRRVWEILSQFGLEALSTQRAGTLSGGQRQRLALAAALANQPKLLLLDEPFGALDALSRRHLQRFFWEHVHGRVTAIFVTHDLEEALLVGDQVQIGVEPSSPRIQVEKHGLSPHEWELREEFGSLRATLITTLEVAGTARTGNADTGS